ncbi:hypothetical protein VYU27_010495 [Nannochloropsis oceanica]
MSVLLEGGTKESDEEEKKRPVSLSAYTALVSLLRQQQQQQQQRREEAEQEGGGGGGEGEGGGGGGAAAIETAVNALGETVEGEGGGGGGGGGGKMTRGEVLAGLEEEGLLSTLFSPSLFLLHPSLPLSLPPQELHTQGHASLSLALTLCRFEGGMEERWWEGGGGRELVMTLLQG